MASARPSAKSSLANSKTCCRWETYEPRGSSELLRDGHRFDREKTFCLHRTVEAHDWRLLVPSKEHRQPGFGDRVFECLSRPTIGYDDLCKLTCPRLLWRQEYCALTGTRPRGQHHAINDARAGGLCSGAVGNRDTPSLHLQAIKGIKADADAHRQESTERAMNARTERDPFIGGLGMDPASGNRDGCRDCERKARYPLHLLCPFDRCCAEFIARTHRHRAATHVHHPRICASQCLRHLMSTVVRIRLILRFCRTPGSMSPAGWVGRGSRPVLVVSPTGFA